MPDGGSVIALTYLGSEKVVPGYNVMGVAKAALESSARYLAFDLGRKNIRVNTHFRRPHRDTLSAKAVGGIDDMFAHMEQKAPLHRNIDGRRSRQDRRLPPQRPLQRRNRREPLRGRRIQYGRPVGFEPRAGRISANAAFPLGMMFTDETTVSLGV